jgi:hypothetical protein
MKGGDNSNYKSNMLLIPSQRLGVVVLINTNDPIGSFFGDIRIAMIGYNVAETLLKQPLTTFPVSPIPTMLRVGLLLILAIQVAGMALTLVRLWRMRSQRASGDLSQQPGRRTMVMQIGLPLVINLAWGLIVLLAVPPFLKMPLSFIQYMLPTLGYTILVSGVVALVWAVVRTMLVYLVIFRTVIPTTKLVGVSVSSSLPS